MHDKDAYAALPEGKRFETRGIEVGHVFNFGTKYSEPMRAKVQTADGQEVAMEMGSYGIGVSRLVGALIEAHHDEDGPIWPLSVAPFQVGIINLKPGDAETDAVCADLEAKFEAASIDFLYDDSSDRPGEKFARMDLCGIPHHITIGPRGIKAGDAEWKQRKTGEKTNIPLAEVAETVAGAVIAELEVLSA